MCLFGLIKIIYIIIEEKTNDTNPIENQPLKNFRCTAKVGDWSVVFNYTFTFYHFGSMLYAVANGQNQII